MADFRLRQAERLKKRKAIELLFSHGRSVRAYPLRIVFLITERQGRFPAQVGTTVPRKLFKRAVDRNRLKRLLREAYRLHKSIIYDVMEDPKKQLSLMVIYTSDEIQAFDTIERALVKAIRLMLDKSRM